MSFNPELKPADLTKTYSYKFSRLRLSSHSMPVELCRWNRMTRDVRLCNECKVFGDKRHYIYDCPTIDRSQLSDLPSPLHKLADYEKTTYLTEFIIHVSVPLIAT